MNFMMPMLAEITATEVGTIIGVILTALLGGGIIGKRAGLKEATNNVTIQQPFPEVPFRKVSNPVSFDQHSALDARVARIELHLDQIQRDQSLQYKQILEAGAERELRMTEVMNEGLREVHRRLDEILTTRPSSRR